MNAQVPDSNLLFGASAAFSASLTWALGSAVYAKLAERSSGARVNFSRALFSFPCYLIVIALSFSEVRAALVELGSGIWKSAAWLALSMLSSYVLADVLFLRSAKLLGIANAQAIASLYPLWSALAGLVFLSEEISLLRTFGLFAAVGGTAFLILLGHQHARQRELDESDVALARAGRKEFKLGVVLALLVSLLWALNSVAVRMGATGLPVPVTNAIRMAFALALTPVVGFMMSGHRGNPAVPLRDLLRNSPIFVFESFGGSLAYVYGMNNAPLAVAAALSSLAPVVSLPVVAWLGIDKITVPKALGIIVVTAGVVCLVV